MRFVLVLLVACSASPAPKPRPIERTRTAHTTTVAPAHDAPSERECDALFTHAMALVLAEHPASDADQAMLRAELRPGFIIDCRAGTRATFACGRAAKTAADLAACR